LYFRRSSNTLNGLFFLICLSSCFYRRWLFAYHGKLACTRIGVAGIDDYAVIGTVVMIPGFAGGFSCGENPADFEFPLFRDEGGILENP
jgi:hypothetical protein